LIALAGVGAETSAVMLAYLNEACARRQRAGTLRTLYDLHETVQQGALERIRPVTMTSLSNILGLMPVMIATGTGADVMRRIAAPMIGGVFTAMLLTLIVIPAVYVIWRWNFEVKLKGTGNTD
jgi:Cu(I)/Ag(I) efflux system membrane protein CusA/SilA